MKGIGKMSDKLRWFSFFLIPMLVLAGAAPMGSQSAAATGELFLVRYQEGTKTAVADQVLVLGGEIRHEFDQINVLAIRLDSGQTAELAAHPGVTAIESDPLYHLFAQEAPYGIDMVQARDTWDADRDGSVDAGAPTGNGIKVCIVDTGILSEHEDLGGGGVEILAGQSWVNEDWSKDGHGHGTHVSGTVTAANNNVGVVGVSPGSVQLIIADVFNDAGDGQASSTILEAANWCADQGANVISMSLGGPIGTLADGYQLLYDRGILIVAAAGNDGGPVNNYPASYPSVMSIAAVDSSGTAASFSNFVPEVELAAPGVNVLSTWAHETSVSVDGGPKFGANPVEFADPAGTTFGPLANGGDCNLPPTPGAFEGDIVLCQRGGLPFKAKIDHAASGGAAAVILWNNEPGNFSGTYTACCSPIPAVSLNQAAGQALAGSWINANVSVLIRASNNAVYAEISGTSMATPHASGVASVLWSACPSLTNDQIRSHLDRFTTESDADLLAGRDIFYGYGIPQLKNAVNALFDGVDEYNLNNPNGEGNNPANAECDSPPPPPPFEGTAKAGGWLTGSDNKKINFSFEVEQSGNSGPLGSLKVNDKSAGAKIEMTTVNSLEDGSSACAEFVGGPAVIRITGEGTYNGEPAEFQACAADNGDPGKGQDQFYLACTTGCDYTTGSSAQSSTLGGGNIDIQTNTGSDAAGEPAATTMILDPLLLSEGLVSQPQTFTVSVYDQNQDLLADATVTLTRTTADGSQETLTAITDLSGVAIFTVVNLEQITEYVATSGNAESNAIEVDPLLN